MKAVLMILLLTIPLFAQQSSFEQASIEYQNGNYQKAKTILEKLSKEDTKDSWKVWNLLGLTHIRLGKYRKAEQALQEATSLAPQESDTRANYAYALMLRQNLTKALEEASRAALVGTDNYWAVFIRGFARFRLLDLDGAAADIDKVIAMKSDYLQAYQLRAEIAVAKFGQGVSGGGAVTDSLRFLDDGVRILEICEVKCRADGAPVDRKEQIAGLKAFKKYFEKGQTIEPDNLAATAERVPVKVLRKVAPGYTDVARLNNIKGLIVVLALFDVNGTVTRAFVVKGLGYGLDERALSAAYQVKFIPAKLNGVNIPVIKRIEYYFDIL